MTHLLSWIAVSEMEDVENMTGTEKKFSAKLTAYVAPIKDYEIIGRDTLRNWGAVLDMRAAEDVRAEEADRGGLNVQTVNQYEGLIVNV